MSLLDAVSKTVTVPLRGKDEEFPKLSYADKAEILRAALKRRRAAEMETLTLVGITGVDALTYLKKIDKEYEAQSAFVDHVNAQGGVDDVMTFILRKSEPAAAADQIALAIEGLYPDEKFAVVLKAANLVPKEATGETPLTSGTGSPPNPADGETSATA